MALDNNILTAKVVLSLWAYPELDDNVQIPLLRSMYDNDPDSRLKTAQIKIYMDGITHQRTAKLKEPYVAEEPDLGIGDNGFNYFTQERLTTYLNQLQNLGNDEGFNFLIHTIGDQAVFEGLNAIEDAAPSKTSKSRHKLTHVEQVDPADFHRFPELDVMADVQVINELFDHNQLE